MELVPIIYTALLIVAVFAIVTIIISYIIFKVKHKRGQVDTPTIDKIVQPVIKVESSVKKAVQRITKPLPPIQTPVKEEFTKHENNYRDTPVNSSSNRTKSGSTKSSGHSNRIEVVKNIKPIREEKVEEQTPPPPPKTADTKKSTNLKSLGDDVLDKYADDKDDDMYTLNVKKKKKD